jgi:hypothetical protein
VRGCTARRRRDAQCALFSCSCVWSLLSDALRCTSTEMHKGVTNTPCASEVCVSPEGVLLAEKNRVVGVHRWVWRCEEAHRALLGRPPVLTRGCGSRIQPGQLSLTRTLRADPPSEQQVHSKVSLRRAVDAV